MSFPLHDQERENRRGCGRLVLHLCCSVYGKSEDICFVAFSKQGILSYKLICGVSHRELSLCVMWAQREDVCIPPLCTASVWWRSLCLRELAGLSPKEHSSGFTDTRENRGRVQIGLGLMLLPSGPRTQPLPVGTWIMF